MDKEKFIKMAEAKYEEIQALNEEPTFLEYEKGFSELWTELGREVLQANLNKEGKESKDRRKKKKIKTTLGEVQLPKSHCYIAKAEHSFAISPLLQSHILEFIANQPFERGMDLLNSVLPGVNASSSQSQRLMQYYGNLEQTEELLVSPGFDTTETLSEKETHCEPILYVEVDGGHLPTDEGYQETKLGRIFVGHHRTQKSSNKHKVELRNELVESDYLAHLGNCKDFTARFNKLVEAHLKQNPRLKMVSINDGADWIGKWLAESFPFATVILDFYHAIEHLAEFAQIALTSTKERTAWIDKCKEELLAGNIDKVINEITLKSDNQQDSIIRKSEQLKNYYNKNRYRMKYNEYLSAGYCIGSGAIESAISTVVQQRCKLVGQRWTERVAAVLNIRAIFKSRKKEKLKDIINAKMGCKKAA